MREIPYIISKILKCSTKTVDKTMIVEYNNGEVRLCSLYILF